MHPNAFDVTLSDDEMTAWIRFNTDTRVTLDELRDGLAAAGVVHGIDAFLLEDLAAAHQSETMYRIATGTSAGEGIAYTFARPTRRQPKRLASGRIDFYNLNPIPYVTRHQILARKVPPAERRAGKTVCGNLISPSDQDEPLPQPGPSVRLDDHGRVLIALTEGYPVLQDGVLRIELTYLVDSDVCFSSGNIDCKGSVVVTGDINNGFRLHAGQSATVHGVVNGGSIHAQSDIHLYGNVFGNQQSTIVSKASVQGLYLNEVTVKVRKDIRLLRGARHCDLDAGGSIFITGNEGHIIGGTVRARNRVVTHHLGSDQAIRTDVEILSSMHDTTTCRDYLTYISAILKEDDAILNHMNEIEALQAQRAMLPPLLKNQLEAMDKLSAYFHLHRPFLPFQSLQNGILVVTGTVYPGVRVKMGDHILSIKEKMIGIIFYKKDDQINIQLLDQDYHVADLY